MAFPGGFGTLDELFEVITLVQTRKAKPVPIVLFGTDYWKRLINLDVLVEEGAISPEDLNLLHYADDPQDAWDTIRAFYEHVKLPEACQAPQLPGVGAAAHEAAHHPEHHRHPDHRAGSAKQHGHQHAGDVDGHQAQGDGLAVPSVRGDLVQRAHDHGLHRAQRQPQQHRAQRPCSTAPA